MGLRIVTVGWSVIFAGHLIGSYLPGIGSLHSRAHSYKGGTGAHAWMTHI